MPVKMNHVLYVKNQRSKRKSDQNISHVKGLTLRVLSIQANYSVSRQEVEKLTKTGNVKQ